jgi:hypothetical protein
MKKHLGLILLAGILAAALFAGCSQNQVEIDPGNIVTEELPTFPASEETDTSEGATPPVSKAPNIVTPEIADEPVTLPPKTTVLPTVLVGDRDHKMVVLAIEDLAERLELDEEGITLTSFESITWPDTSLGCPQPNMFYAQVLTPGYRIILEAGGEVYRYHTDLEGEIILCDLKAPPNLKETPLTRD